MIKVAIKNENVTPFGGIYHIMDVFSKLDFEGLTESVLGRRGCSGKAFSAMEAFSAPFSPATFVAETALRTSMRS